MMMDPKSYKEMYKKRPLNKILVERIKLINDIVEYEQNHILNDNPEEPVKTSWCRFSRNALEYFQN